MLSLRGSVIVSACLHAGIFVALMGISSFSGARTVYRPSYQVRLVSPGELPTAGKPQGAEKKAVPAPPAPKPEVSTAPPAEKKPEVVVKPREESKKPEPKPREDVKKQVEAKQEEEMLGDVLARIKKKVGKTGQTVARTGGASGGGWGERQKEIQYQSYHDQIYQVVRSNWINPPNFDLNRKDIITVVSITILPDGRISNTYIEQSSGDPLFDQSALRAILKSDPLPPPPIGLETQTYDLGLNFFP